jgi:hypothetical protein
VPILEEWPVEIALVAHNDQKNGRGLFRKRTPCSLLPCPFDVQLPSKRGFCFATKA